MWKAQLLIFIVALALVYGDATVYSVDYILGPSFSPYIYKIQSDSNIHNLWLRSYPLYDTNFVASVIDPLPQPAPNFKVMGGLQYSYTKGDYEFLTIFTYNNGTLFTRINYHDSNPLSMNILGHTDIPAVVPMIFSSSYTVLITANATLDPFTGQNVAMAKPFQFNPNGYTWLSYKGYYELILNYDYPYVHLIDTSSPTPWPVYTLSVPYTFTSNPTNLYYTYGNYTAAATGSTIYIYRSFDFSVVSNLTLPGVYITKLFYLEATRSLYGWDNTSATLYVLQVSIGPTLSTQGNFTFPPTVFYPVVASSAIDAKTGLYVNNIIVEVGYAQTPSSLTTYPLTCPFGYYSDLGGCKLCPGGYIGGFQSYLGISSCVACQQGWYSNEGRTTCVPCPSGQSTDELHLTTNPSFPCFPCPLDTFESNHLCVDCDAVSYADVVGSSQCTSCPTNTVRQRTTNGPCGRCPIAGQYADSIDGCIDCPAGTYATDLGCTTCPNGTFTFDHVNCYSCGMGSIPNENQTNCELCTEGNYALIGDAVCSPCPPGTYAVNGICETCADGTYNVNPGATQCSPCDKAQGSNTNRTGCEKCAPGTYGNAVGAGCAACEIDTYSPDPGSQSCLPCPTDAYCPIRSAKLLSSELAQSSVVAKGFSTNSDSNLSSSVLTSFLVTGGIGLLVLLIFFLFLVIASCSDGQRCGGIHTLMIKLDLLYSTKHATANGSYLINQQKVTGGFFTISAFATIIVLVVSSLVQYATSNVILRSTIEPGIPTQQEVQNIYILLTLSTISENQCTSDLVSIDFAGFPANNNNTLSPYYTDNGCVISWYCGNSCQFQFGKEVYIRYNFGLDAYIPSWNVTMSLPYFRGQVFHLQTNAVPLAPKGNIFHYGESAINIIFTPAVYTPLRSNVQNAFQLQYGAVNLGAPYPINQGSPDPLALKISLQQNTVTYKEDEIEKVSPLGMLSQLLALIGGSITFWGVVMTGIDKWDLKKKGNDDNIEMKFTH